MFTKSLKKLYSQQGPITVQCNPENCAWRLFPGTGSADFLDLWAQGQVVFTFREMAAEARNLKGMTGSWRWRACRRATVTVCCIWMWTSAWLLHVKIILSWDPECHCAAHPSVYGTTGHLKTGPLAYCQPGQLEGNRGRAKCSLTLEFDVEEWPWTLGLRWSPVRILILSYQLSHLTSGSLSSLFLNGVIIRTSPSCFRSNELVDGKQVAEYLPQDRPSIHVFLLFPFDSLPPPPWWFSPLPQAPSIFSVLCSQFAVTLPFLWSWLTEALRILYPKYNM